MKLKNFKTLWGFEGDFEIACKEASKAGFEGIEGQAPKELDEQLYWRECLDKYELDFIGEIVTGGDYVPARHHTIQEHLEDVEEGIKNSLKLSASFVTCIGGCDAWSEAESREFFQNAITLAKKYEIDISFETHRSRSLFTPWVTKRVVDALPEMKLTLDMSHWCVVCERLMDTELETIKAIASNVHHIHARVGYEQGPQVPHPRAPEYQGALISHQGIWELIWSAQKEKGMQTTTITPEFGPDGYLHTLPFTNVPVADLWEINCWMAATEKSHFYAYSKREGIL
ncbi:TIM barrel protein [Sulfurimonas sp. C5]|uniref:sugar phosphate isomerase/epimerase family protein n=1 Tax=Sulfurimonas sp. C5 TaxID=3036947 RepID=UPI002456808A|nr:TIM barrel protein [Sulfurimonas sp. C5]MDH4945071.1 TIM barrel protein [Sulfurimonas sp. C5]